MSPNRETYNYRSQWCHNKPLILDQFCRTLNDSVFNIEKIMNTKLPIAIAALAILLTCTVAHAQAPNLGVVNTFGLFTAVGDIDNFGATIIAGDAGTDVGAFNGIPPAVVLGQMHLADPVSAQAAIDVNLAYSQLQSMTCGAVLGTGLGGGQVLTPGVYCIGGAATLNGNLTFDAQGDPNALFFIQVSAALSTGVASQVLLLNAASSCNIYWQVDGAVSLGDNSIFQGTLLSNGQLTMLSGATVDGKTLLISGAIVLNDNMVNDCAPSLMPITLADFNAQKSADESGALLTWNTHSESNSDYFLIERSTNGIEFVTIGKLLAAGNSDHLLSYTFEDEAPVSGHNDYRLQQVDQDGAATFSKVESLNFVALSNSVQVSPNPFGSSLILRLHGDLGDAAFEWTMTDAMGRSIMQYRLLAGVTAVDMTHVASGIYFCQLTRNGVVVQTGKLIARQ